jgi:uncharacterized protein (DUF983 family)
MGDLGRRVERLEAMTPDCAACGAGRIYMPPERPPAACPACGRPIEAAEFTIRIDAGRDDRA